MATTNGTRLTFCGFVAIVTITLASVGYTNATCSDARTDTYSTVHGAPAPVAEKCAPFELHLVRLNVEPVAAVAQRSVHARNWQLSYRALAFGRV